jgi:hypothetical protein
LGNINYLLSVSRGKYFTLIADDDLYAPNFLEAINASLIKYNYPACIYTSFDIVSGNKYGNHKKELVSVPVLYKGSKFLNLYWKGKIKTIGLYGVFNVDYLKSIDGVEDISNEGNGLYCEYMHIIKVGLLEKVCFINAPLVYYRIHSGAWGCVNADVKIYKRAGENLIRNSIEILKSPQLEKDFQENLFSLFIMCMGNYFAILKRSKIPVYKYHIIKYLFSLRKYIDSLKGSKLYVKAYWVLCMAEIWFVLSMIWHIFKSIVPNNIAMNKIRLLFPKRI